MNKECGPEETKEEAREIIREAKEFSDSSKRAKGA